MILWTGTDENETPLDALYNVSDFAPEAITKAEADCTKFQSKNADDLLTAREMGEGDERASHDFALTRNGHGAGFWDRDLEDVGDRLTVACKGFGETDAYVGDDGRIYLS